MPATELPPTILAIRPATADDAAAVARVAALDSAAVPTGALLLGVADGLPVAAISVDTGTVIADPFFPTAGLVALLRQRADRLRPPAARHRGFRDLLPRRRPCPPAPPGGARARR